MHQDLKIDDRLSFKINSYGNQGIKEKYIEELKEFYKSKERSIPFDYKELVDRDPLQLFLIKDEDLEIINEMAPNIEDFYDKDAKEYLDTLC